MKRLAMGMMICLLQGGGHAQASPGLALYLADAPRPGILTGCQLFYFARTASQPWRQVTQPLRLDWEGGGIQLNAESAASPAPLREHCFRIELDGQILAGGAVISPHSARYLDFPVLLEHPGEDGQPPTLRLLPSWTAGGDNPGLSNRLARPTAILRERFP